MLVQVAANINDHFRYLLDFLRVPGSRSLGLIQTWLQQGAADVAALVSELGLDTTLGAKHKASKLNEPIELDEMAVVFNKLKRGKAAGPDGIRAEFLKDAVVREFEEEDGSHPVFRNVLLEPVHAVINAFFESGDPPVSWSEAAISAVFKKGDPTCKDNYRGIAVGNVFGKVFSMVLEQRLSKWSEEHGHRAQAQAGFRKGMRTTDQLFILRHVIDKYRLQKKPLFCCFVDFKKAYDSVDRRLLLQRLASLGIWGTMLTSIAAMYRNVPLHARVDGKVGPAFQSSIGVKQGDPLSPLLFGLFIDELEDFVRQRLPNSGAQVGPSKCQLLLYADDVVLFAETAVELQSQLDALKEFCDLKHMTVNVQKTQILSCRSRDAVGCSWQYAGEAIEVVSTFKYLGITVESDRGFKGAVDVMRCAATKAMWSVVRQTQERDIQQIALRVLLFKSMVIPVMSYGCEIWSLPFLTSNLPLGNPLQKVQNMFLRQVSGTWLRKSVSQRLLHEELGCMPVSFTWVKMACGFWNRLVAQTSAPMLRAAFTENLELSIVAGHGRLWSAEMMKCLKDVVPDYAEKVTSLVLNRSVTEIERVDTEVVLGTWGSKWTACWCDLPEDPRVASSDQVSYATYYTWMAECVSQPARYVDHDRCINPEYLADLMRFRVGAHWLSVVTGRWADGGTVRAQRYCRKCMAYTVEDEKHFMLECPAYQEIRSEFGELFDYCEGDLRKLMCHPKQHMLAKLVHKMRVFRDEDTEWVFDLQLDRFESSEDESCGNVSSDEYENELVEVDDISQFGFVEAP